MADKGLVLITGSNGYIAARTVEAFLKAGYSARGTVRSLKSAEGLLEILKDYAQSGRLEFVEVPDITKDGAFDKAVAGVHAIAHMASPVSQHFTDPEPIIRTAVSGTTSILNSAARLAGPQLSTFVLISSIGAVISPKDPPYGYTEADWNTLSEAEVARLGKRTPGGHIYRASKIAGERAFWKFRDEANPTFTMTALNPAYVSGPPLVLPETPDKINETVIAVWTVLSGQDIPPSLGGSGGFVDVRDVARLMVFAVDHPEKADGQRYIACGGTGAMQAIADILNKHYPQRKGVIKEGHPGDGYVPGYGFAKSGFWVDASKAVEATGKEWIDYEKSVVDAAKAFERYL